MEGNKYREKLLLLTILLMSLFLYTWRAGDIVFVDEDEARYAQAASEMVESGDWLTPHLNFEVFHDKQPLVYWLNAICFLMFGRNEFSVRIWHSLMAVAGVYVVYLIGRELFDSKTGLLSSAIFATGLFYFYQSRSPLMDIPLNLFISLSFYFFILFTGTKKLHFNYLFWACLGLAVMTKGLVGLVLPCMITGIFLVIKYKKNFFSYIRTYFLHIAGGIGVFLLIAAPWHIIEYYLHGNIFIENVFMKLTFRRYFMGDGAVVPSHNFFTHFITILYGSLPWSGFLLPGIILLLKDKDQWGRRNFIFIWILTVFLLFSISAPKRIRYIMPMFPALSLIAGYLWNKYFSEDSIKKYMNLSAVLSLPLGILIFLAILFAKMKFPEDYERFSYFCVPPLLILAFAIVIPSVMIFFKRKKSAFMAFIILTFCSYSFLVWSSGEYFNQVKPVKSLSLMINEQIKKGDRVGSFVNLHPSLIFYTDHKVEYLLTREELAEFFASKDHVFCVAETVDLQVKEFGDFYKVPVFILEEQAGFLLLSNRKE
ncbi:MAG: glycosyltransferase family 39 protein [Candidatus Eremiobacterota bacterium]